MNNKKEQPTFISLPIETIFPNEALPGEVYLFINGHFIKYKNKDDQIDQNKYEQFVLQKMQFLFTTQANAEVFSDWTRQIKSVQRDKILSNIGKDNSDLLDIHENIKNDVFMFLTDEISHEKTKELLDKTRNLVSKIKSRHNSNRFMAQILNYDQNVADHSTNVANLSVFFALNIGYSQQIILENIYIGALMHDFGKVKIDPKILENTDSNIYKTAIRKHPELGKTSLLIDGQFSEEVLRIIGEHHERHNGTGFPKGLKGGRIYELTKIVSIANIFDNLVMNGTGDIKTRQHNAFRSIEKDQGVMFDPKILAKCLRVLENVLFN